MGTDLGKFLFFSFIEEFIPSHMQEIYKIFHRKGSYSSYKLFLKRRNCAEKWYRYEKTETKNALLNWCKVNGINVDI